MNQSNISGIDTAFIKADVTLDKIQKPVDTVDMNQNLLSNVKDPVSAQDAVTKQFAANTYLSQASAVQNYLSKADTNINSLQPQNANYSVNGYKLTNLLNGTNAQDAITKTQLDNDIKPMIRNTSSSCNVEAVLSGIDITIDNQADKLKLFIPQGQPTKPICLSTDDKLQFVSGLGSISYNSTLPQDQLYNNFGMYMQQPGNDMTKNQNVQFMLQCTNNSGSQQSQALTFSTGHINVGAGMQNYSLIYNKTPDGIAQNLQISAGLPQSDQTLTFYSDTFATSLNIPLTAIFSKKVGYASSIAITDNFQFPNKLYVDTAIGGLASIYQTQAAMSSYYTKTNIDANIYTKIQSDANYYSKTASDARYYANTVTLNNIVSPTANLSINTYKLTNVGDPTLIYDAANKNYVDSQVVALGSVYQLQSAMSSYYTKTASDALYQTLTGMTSYYSKTQSDALYQTLANMANYSTTSQANALYQTLAGMSNYSTTNQANALYYANTVPVNQLTLASGSLSLNSQKITNLGIPTLSTDASTKGYTDTQISGLSSVYQTQAAMTNYQTTTQADAKYYANTRTLDSLTLATDSLSLNSQKITNLANPVSNQDASTKTYVDSAISGLSAIYQTITSMTDYYTKVASDARYYLSTTRLHSILAPTSAVSFNSQKLTNLATPTDNTDASTKLYVDQAVSNVGGGNVPIGTIIIWISDTIPSGWLLLNGQSYNTTTYAVLFTVLGTSTVPDFRGYFLRAHDSSRLIDKQANRAIKSTQDDLVKGHSHNVPENTYTTSTDAGHVHAVKYKNTNSGDSGQAAESSTGGSDGTYNTNLGGAHSHSVVITAHDTDLNYGHDFFETIAANEVRPRNIAVHYIIRAI